MVWGAMDEPLTIADIAHRECCEAFARTWLSCSLEKRAAQLRQEWKLARRWASRAAAAARKAEEVDTLGATMRANAIRRRAECHVENYQLLEAASLTCPL